MKGKRKGFHRFIAFCCYLIMPFQNFALYQGLQSPFCDISIALFDDSFVFMPSIAQDCLHCFSEDETQLILPEDGSKVFAC